jgi:hypothetical protein
MELKSNRLTLMSARHERPLTMTWSWRRQGLKPLPDIGKEGGIHLRGAAFRFAGMLRCPRDEIFTRYES